MASLSLKDGIKKKAIKKKKSQYMVRLSKTTCKSDIPLALLLKMRKHRVVVRYQDSDMI